MDLVYFIVLVGVLIFVHEAGHFVWAKVFRVRVLTFSLGFGPKVASFSRGGTDYVLAAIPLGGYVRMLGEHPTDVVGDGERGQAFAEKPLWQRVVIVFAGPLMNLAFPVFLYFLAFLGTSELSPALVGDVFPAQPAEGKLLPGDRVLAIDGEDVQTFRDMTRIVGPHAGHTLSFLVERGGEHLTFPITPTPKRVERPLDLSEEVGRVGVSLHQPLSVVGVIDGSPADQAGLKTFDWVVSVGGKPTLRWVDLTRALERNRGSLVPLTVLRPGQLDGPLGAFGVSTYTPRVVTIAPEPGDELAKKRTGLEPSDLYVSFVSPDSPEARAGLRVGDRLLSLDDRPIRHWTSFVELLEAERGRGHGLTVRRGADTLQVSYRLARRHGMSEQGVSFDRYLVGLRRFAPTQAFPKIPNPSPVSYALGEAVRATGDVVELTITSIVRLFQGRLSMKSLGGPLMIYDAASDAAREGASNYLFLMGFISVNLGIINLMPIPLLDGGTLSFLLYELVARRPVSVRVREVASLCGLAVLLLLMVFAFKNDVERQWPELFGAASQEP
jgi:regulator of sigma E protease